MAWSNPDAQDERERVQREIAKRRERGEPFEPLVAPARGKLAQKFWGQAWQKRLESYADYEQRLPRGRSYLRNGQVYDLAIEGREVTATVAGQQLYSVRIMFQALDAEDWQEIQHQCSGQVGSLLDLLSGQVGEGVLKVITDPEHGLFPRPREIKLSCDCPDYADLCKHAAAVLYGVGLRFDAQPELFFQLRGVKPAELLSHAAQSLEPSTTDTVLLPEDDLADIFGIELGGSAATENLK